MTQDELKCLMHYDPDTGIFTSKIKRGKVTVGKKVGTLNPLNGYLKCCVNRKQYQMHRLAWLYVYGKFPDKEIDHINGIKTDNRISNLRDVTPSENQHNKWKAQSNNKSGLLGAFYVKREGRYMSYISCNKKRHYLGLFDTDQKAHEAYMEAKIKLHTSANRHNK